MPPDEGPLRCLAVRVMHDAQGRIDSIELENLMKDLAGPGQWISTGEWLFIDPPLAGADQITAPVVMAQTTAIKAILADLTRSPSRIITDYALAPGEIRKWRWLAFQRSPNAEGRGVFPWEAPHG